MDEQNKKKAFLERLLATFRVEAGEHIKAITSGLIQLEKSSDTHRQEQLIETIYREAHSLKGAARSVDLTAIEAICQALESVLRKFKHSGFSPRAGVFDVLHQAVDIIDKLNFPGTESAPGNTEIAGVVQQLAELEKAPKVLKTNENEEMAQVKTGAEDKVKSRENRRLVLEAVEARRQQKLRDRQAADTAGHNTPYRSNIHAFPVSFAAGTVRVSTAKLDSVLLQTEELIYGKLYLKRLAGELDNILEELNTCRKKPQMISPTFIKCLQKKLREISKSLENERFFFGSLIDTHLEDIKELLMLPFSTLTEGFPKVVRDLARAKGKEVDIIIGGAESEVDKRVLEGIKTPLLHLLRNAVDHGIEAPQARIRKGKPAAGTIRIIVSRLESGKVMINFSDDGAGIDLEKIKEKSIGSGLITAEKFQKLTNWEILDMIFRSEFSTATLSSDISGRGLGLPIARENVEKLGGTISVTSEADKGTTFCIVLPLALGAFRGVLVKAGTTKFIIPILDVERTLRVRPGDIKTVENRETVLIDGRAVSHISLADVLKLPWEPQSDNAPQFIQMLQLSDDGIQIAFSVDEVLDKEEALVKSLGRQLRRVINISGAVILGSAEVVPILNVPDLIKSAVRMSGQPPVQKEKIKIPKPRSVLLVENSITSRVLLKNVMESAGYRIVTAVDGAAGWASLQQESFDIVVLDVDMPGMDGFELTAKIRANKNLAAIPVVLITDLENGADREKGIEVGANAYIVKSKFDQGNLLAVLKKLV